MSHRSSSPISSGQTLIIGLFGVLFYVVMKLGLEEITNELIFHNGLGALIGVPFGSQVEILNERIMARFGKTLSTSQNVDRTDWTRFGRSP